MYYLSRVEIDDNNRQKLKDLTHVGAYHAWVEDSFRNKEIKETQRSRKLWRIDELALKRYLIVLSDQRPNLELLEKYGVPNSAQTKKYDNFLAKLKQNQIYRFRLTANPTHKVSSPNDPKGKVYPHVTVLQQEKWLIDRSNKLGFKILKGATGNYEFNIKDRQYVNLYHKHQKRVKLSQVTFEGVLKITDMDKFKKILVTGIGREKAYGMGLLTVIPIKV